MPTTSARLTPVPKLRSATPWSKAQQTFLKRDLAPGSRRIYGLTLNRVSALLGPDLLLHDLAGYELADALHQAYPDASPASAPTVSQPPAPSRSRVPPSTPPTSMVSHKAAYGLNHWPTRPLNGSPSTHSSWRQWVSRMDILRNYH